ncbi:helix-turn-helix domain-containing protein [Cryobacterium aureum]|uniref:helix-turn-helix domain-containing protein n=1 Tax=Cryobacterium aureum TaxID=995037 RepID=UPI000CF43A77|nr:helix-turn-helix transcriptional regulator [Cryobacterium aureum]
MTEQPNVVVDWVAELEANPKYQLEEAAAELAMEMSEILIHAFRVRTDIDQKDLAERLGVSEGRVSQVLHGDGNVHVATIAKYLRALGYALQVIPRPVDQESPSLVRNSRRKMVAHIYKTTFADGTGVSDHYTSIVGASPVAKEALDRPRLVSSRSLSAVKRAYLDDLVTATVKEPPARLTRTRQAVVAE